MIDFLSRANIPGFDARSYITNLKQNATALPNVAIGASGGGYRAMLNGGGAILAFDSREPESNAAGGLGGLLQSSTYLAGLSGGGWLVGAIMVNNFTSISALRNDRASNVWELQNSIFKGPDKGKIQALSSGQYYDDISNQVDRKKDAGYQTSITDYWGRALSYQLVNTSSGGPSQTWSSIQLQDSFANADIPLPILVADGRAPGEKLISLNCTVYEFNPWELGTWDPTLAGFVPLEFLGSNFTNGRLPDNANCVRGFDNVGFIMGTSSSLFNQFLLNINSTSVPDLAKKLISKILTTIGSDNNDIADYTPNPFLGFNTQSNRNANSTRLTLVDGGSDLQNIPLHPLIQPKRKVDVIFAIDSSADTNSSWPNGTSMVATYERSLSPIANGTAFPAVPDVNTFVNLGLNNRPTFFGCNSSNTTSMTPLIVYLPNAPYVFHSNISTFTPDYTPGTRNAILENGYQGATQGNGTADPNWHACVACAVLSRSLERTNTPVPDTCKQCFSRYCWDGKTDPKTPPTYEPPYKFQNVAIKSAAERGMGSPTSFATLLLVLAGVIIAWL